MVESNELMKFMEQKLGGKNAVVQAYAKEQLIKAISGGTTIGELIEKAKQDDWLPLLLATPIASLAGQARAASPAPEKSTGRLTAEQKETLVGGILDYLKDNPWSGKSAIVKAVGFDSTKVAVQLRGLRNDGQIKSSGVKANTTYALKGEKSKA